MGPTSNAKKEKKYPMPSGSHRVCNVDKPPNPGEDLLLSFSSRLQEWNDSPCGLQANNSWTQGRGKRYGPERGSQAGKKYNPEVFALQLTKCSGLDCGSSVRGRTHYHSTNTFCQATHGEPEQSKVRPVVSSPLQEGDAK